MKTLKRVNKKNKSAILLVSILSMMLSIIPLHGSENPGKDGGKIDFEERMTLPFEVLNADYEAELEIEEWMTVSWI